MGYELYFSVQPEIPTQKEFSSILDHDFLVCFYNIVKLKILERYHDDSVFMGS